LSSNAIGRDSPLSTQDIIISIDVFSPQEYGVYGHAAPQFNVSFSGLDINVTWYQLKGNNQQFFISNGAGSINQTVWDSFGNGTVIFQFCANTSGSQIYCKEVTVRKDIIHPQIFLMFPRPYQSFGCTPPNISLLIYDFHFNSVYLEFNYQKYDKAYFSLISNSIGSPIYECIFKLNSSFWNNVSAGQVHISIVAQDDAGNYASETLILIKTEPEPYSPPPSDPYIPGYPLIFILSLIILLNVLIYKYKISRNQLKAKL
jgi:hypothetical protein